MLKFFLGLTGLLLVACASASIAPEEDRSLPPAGGAEAAKPGLVEPAAAAKAGEPSQAIPQQADNLGDARPVKPAAIPATSIPAIEIAGEESEPVAPAPAGTGRVASDISSGVPQSDPADAVAAEEAASAVSSQPDSETLQAPAAGPKDASPKISLPKAPAFTLTSATGEPFSLETYRGESKVVLIFFRGFW